MTKISINNHQTHCTRLPLKLTQPIQLTIVTEWCLIHSLTYVSERCCHTRGCVIYCRPTQMLSTLECILPWMLSYIDIVCCRRLRASKPPNLNATKTGQWRTRKVSSDLVPTANGIQASRNVGQSEFSRWRNTSAWCMHATVRGQVKRNEQDSSCSKRLRETERICSFNLITTESQI